MIKLVDILMLKEEAVRFNSNNVKPGETYTESEVYSYCQKIHGNQEDFEDGDVGQRIEKYRTYRVELLNVENLDLERFQIHRNRVEKHTKLYEKYKAYLPIVVESNKREVIDGNHRAIALKELGKKEVLAFVGVK